MYILQKDKFWKRILNTVLINVWITIRVSSAWCPLNLKIISVVATGSIVVSHLRNPRDLGISSRFVYDVVLIYKCFTVRIFFNERICENYTTTYCDIYSVSIYAIRVDVIDCIYPERVNFISSKRI